MRLIEAAEGRAVAAPTGRSAVMRVERDIGKLPQVKLHVEHGFSPGIYTRTLYIPKGTVLAGRIHRYEHFNVVLMGTIDVMTEKGMRRITGPAMFKSPPGVKRAGYAHTDTTWTTIHANPKELRDPDELERVNTVDSFDELKDFVIEGDFE